jgi:hypothetical protein
MLHFCVGRPAPTQEFKPPSRLTTLENLASCRAFVAIAPLLPIWHDTTMLASASPRAFLVSSTNAGLTCRLTSSHEAKRVSCLLSRPAGPQSVPMLLTLKTNRARSGLRRVLPHVGTHLSCFEVEEPRYINRADNVLIGVLLRRSDV